MTDWGRKMFVTPGVVVDGKLVTTDLVEDQSRHPHPARQLVLRRLGGPGDVRHPRSARQPGRPPPSLEPAHHPAAAEARLRQQVQLGDVAALVRRQGPPRRWTPAAARWRGCGRRRWPGWSTSATSRRPATASSSICPRRATKPEVTFEWKIPQWRNTIERDRARTYFQAYAARLRPALHREGAGRGARRPHRRPGSRSRCRTRAIGCGFTEAVRGVLSHHMVIRDGKIANYHPYPPTPWNASPRDTYGTPGPYEDAVQEHADLRGERRRRQVQGHRHHAHRAQLRSLPAVRRAHVSRQRASVLEKMHSPAMLNEVVAARRCAPDGARTVTGRNGKGDHGAANDVRQAGERIEQLLEEVHGMVSPPAAERIDELVRLDRRAVRRRTRADHRRAADHGRRRRDARRACADDPLIASLLVVHGLHPDGLATRVERALERVRPYLGSHGGDVDAARHRRSDGVVRLRMEGSCDGCPSSSGDRQARRGRRDPRARAGGDADRGRGPRPRRRGGQPSIAGLDGSTAMRAAADGPPTWAALGGSDGLLHAGRRHGRRVTAPIIVLCRVW